MKIIFDFDDTIFDAQSFKQYIYKCLEAHGISRDISEEFYKEVRQNDTPFSLKEFLSTMATRAKLPMDIVNELYEQILDGTPQFIRTEFLEIIRKLDKQDCYIVTNGDDEFQRVKIDRSGVSPLFAEIYTTTDSKKKIIETICGKHKTEKIIFIDDKEKFFSDLDLQTYNNLKTILCGADGLQSLVLEINTE